MKSEYMKEKVLDGIYAESTGEYTLPDYNGDVRRVISVYPMLMHSDGFADESGITFSGEVNYSIVYLDSENKLAHSEFSTDYEYKVKCNMDTYVDSLAEEIISNYNVRLVGPRKFSAKCAISALVHVSERGECEVEGDLLTSREPEKLSETVRVGKIIKDKTDEREYAQRIEHIDGVMADECEILTSSIAVKNESVVVNNSCGIHRGVISVTCLVSCKDEVPHRASLEIPFENTFFEDEGIGTVGDASALLSVTSFRCSVVPDEEGVDIVASVIAEGEMAIVSNTGVEIIKDAYSTESGCENVYGDFRYREYLGLCEERMPVSGKITAAEVGCEEIRNVLFSDARARITDKEIEGERLKIKGEVRFSGIACQINEEGAPSYVGIKAEIPFEKNVNNTLHLTSSDKINVSVLAEDCAIDVDKTHVMPECNVSIRIEAYRENMADCLLSSYLTDEKYAREEGTVTVYYPDYGETLFDIAKKYHISRVSLASVNSITESVFNDTSSSVRSMGIGKLIIR